MDKSSEDPPSISQLISHVSYPALTFSKKLFPGSETIFATLCCLLTLRQYMEPWHIKFCTEIDSISNVAPMPLSISFPWPLAQMFSLLAS